MLTHRWIIPERSVAEPFGDPPRIRSDLGGESQCLEMLENDFATALKVRPVRTTEELN